MSLNLYGIARIGRDAELRHTAQGEAVANLSLAFNYGRKDSSGKTPTQWVDGALWGKRAESLAQYLIKGQAVMVTLKDVHNETFKNRDGGESVKLVGSVTEIEFAGPPPQAAAAPVPPRQTPARQPAPQPQRTSTGFEDMSDDLDAPF